MTFKMKYPELSEGQRAMLLNDLLECLGEDEPIEINDLNYGPGLDNAAVARNELRAELRAAIRAYVGEEK